MVGYTSNRTDHCISKGSREADPIEYTERLDMKVHLTQYEDQEGPKSAVCKLEHQEPSGEIQTVALSTGWGGTLG